ncbi:MAG: non-ribosomal peptide synthetase [Polyangiales bacterium]
MMQQHVESASHIDDVFPASYGQQRLWFLDQLGHAAGLYNIPMSFRIPGGYDVAVLQRCLREIQRRHEVLRTTFDLQDGELKQIIAAESCIDVRFRDLAEVAADLRMELARQEMTAQARAPFDLRRGPLLRCSVYRLAQDDHLLHVVVHHIAFDGWSADVFLRELGALYPAFAAGQPSPLADLPMQYVDYAQWQRQWMLSGGLEAQLAYWQTQLEGAPQLQSLPSLRSRPAQRRYAGGSVGFSLPSTQAEGLRQLARAEGATLFMTLLALFKVCVFRYTGERDIVVGTPVANRGQRQTEQLIGFFVNTLVLRTDLGEQPTFRSVLRRVREVALEAYAHQDIPFERLVEALRPERSLSHSPLFQLAFTLDSSAAGTAAVAPPDAAAGDRYIAPQVGTGTAKFDLTLAFVEQGQQLHGGVEYDVDLFDAGDIERFVGHLQNLAAAVVANPDVPVATLPMLSASERQTLLVDWNDTTGDDAFMPLTRRFEAHARQCPEAEALVTTSQVWRYGELNQHSNRLARLLQQHGVGPERVVALCARRSVWTVCAKLAILKAGGAYLPFEPNLPAARVAHMLAEAQPVLALTDEAGQAALAGAGLPIWRLDAEHAEWHNLDGADLDVAPQAAHLAYVIYTSGSTGRPKGVMVEHRGLSHIPDVQAAVYGIGAGDRLLHFAPLTFDTSTCEMAIALGTGAALCIASGDAGYPGPAMIDFMQDARVNAAVLAPSVLAALPAEAATRLSLRVLALAGEAVSTAHAHWLVPGRRVFNSYGPTESTIWTTSARWSDSTRAPSIGRPVPGARVYILDAAQQPVPVGVPGEIFIGGRVVARGYLGQAEQSRARFLPDPFCPGGQGRMYRSGDMARYLPHGDIEFLGRRDGQVKIRGFRVEVGEVQAALLTHAQVQAAVVHSYQDARQQTALAAYIVPGPGPSPNRAELRTHLAASLPDYMIPSAFVTLETLPLTRHGKVDYSALPAPQAVEAVQTYAPPRTDMERTLVAIWAEVLGAPKVGVHDNFFALGGHSLLAAQLVAQVAERCGAPLTVRQIFDHPTVADLAAHLAQPAATGVAEPPPIVPLERANRRPPSSRSVQATPVSQP